MGKGTIISGGTGGQYQVAVNYDRTQYDKLIQALDDNIVLITETITGLTPGTTEYNTAILQRTALELRKSELEGNMPDDETVAAWCADLTEDLTGIVTTVEIPGESTVIQIAPGFEGGAEYVPDTSGQLVPTVAQGAAQAFYNLAMLPGWQKWKPTYRYGTISDIDTGVNTCTVTLEDYRSSQQSLVINQSGTLSDVPIEYMSCGGAAFTDGDIVLVQFVGQDWSNPKVIGFKDNPKPCGEYLLIHCWDTTGDVYVGGYDIDDRFNLYYVFDFDLMDAAVDIPADDTGTKFLTFPCNQEDIIYWLSTTEESTPHVDLTRKGSSLRYTDTDPEYIEMGGETFVNSQILVESGGIIPFDANLYYGDIYNRSGVTNNRDFTWTVDQTLYVGYDGGDIAPRLTRESFTVGHNGSSGGCGYDFTQTWEDTFTLKTPYLDRDILTTSYDLSFVGTGGTESFTSCGLDASVTTHAMGITWWVIQDPSFVAYKLSNKNSTVILNYVSWNTMSVTPIPPYEKNDMCAQIASKCNDADTPIVYFESDTWQDFLDVRVAYNSGGLADLDYSTMIESPKLKEYVRSIYDKYRTNGYPSTAVLGPTKRVGWEFSTRR